MNIFNLISTLITAIAAIIYFNQDYIMSGWLLTIICLLDVIGIIYQIERKK